MASRKSGSKHYFILNKTSPYFPALQDDPLVVPNFTLKAYWLIFRANVSITTEAPLHVNILRGNNRPLRLALYESFVFLQHGITYLKRQGKASAFVAGKEAEPDYIVTGSDKESAIMSDMLNIPAERMLQSGLIIFDHIKYGHITQKSEDIATIMLTWRPYEEHLTDFSKSSYYYEVNKVFATLTRYLPKENIRIVAHPRMKQLLESTDMKNSMWHGSIEEVLSEAKLLVTDYSSVCYNTFYRGGGVIFYQPDLERFEAAVGELIPANDEYIGKRAFNTESLNNVLEESIKDLVIDLTKLGTGKFIYNYSTINQFNDGKNTERLNRQLLESNII